MNWTRRTPIVICALMLFGTAASTALHFSPLQATSVKRSGQVSSINIPVTSSPYYTGTLGVVAGHIVVGDETGGTRCRLAVVKPSSLKLISNKSVSCNNPELSGENVMPIESVPHPDTQTGVVRISTYDERTKTFHVGPVVFHYGNFSDTRPEWIYSDRFLWIFDADGFTTGTLKNGRALLLQVSLSSGKVLAHFAAPATERILLAADDDGLWFARSVESGWPIHTPRPSSTLYFLGNHATHFVVVSKKGLFVGWLAASGHVARAFVVESTQTGAGEVDSFSSPSSKPSLVKIVPNKNTVIPRDIGEETFDSGPVLMFGNDVVFVTQLFSTSDSAEVTSQQVFVFNSATGHETKIATIPSPPYEYYQPNIVYDGSLYLLVGAGQTVSSVKLYRVKL